MVDYLILTQLEVETISLKKGCSQCVVHFERKNTNTQYKVRIVFYYKLSDKEINISKNTNFSG